MPDFFRRDQEDGITPPNLADRSSYAEHIVHARGKRTRFTSLSIDPATIVEFGPQLWSLRQPDIYEGGHGVMGHEALLTALREATRASPDPVAREIASRALPRATQRREALVTWKFDVSRVPRKELSEWARPHVRPYFSRA